MTLQKKKLYKEWQILKPNASLWDDKMIYQPLGRPPLADQKPVEQKTDEAWDEIFQISCVNHHVALMKMRISKKYLTWLETGRVSPKEGIDGSDLTEDPKADVLRVYRSRWYDLYDIGQRKDFVVGLWRVMCWLCRDSVSKAEYEKMNESKQAFKDGSEIGGSVVNSAEKMKREKLPAESKD